jgi:hypothetical protein
VEYRPIENEYAEYYKRYINLVPEENILGVLESQIDVIRNTAEVISKDRETYRYESGKWSIREVFGHVIDVERVFGFRAFCFSRKELQPLPSFEQDMYIENGSYDQTELKELAVEFGELRKSHLYVLKRIDQNQWKQIGKASGYDVSVRALAYMMAGHVRHHLNVLDQLYNVRLAK